MPTGDLLMSEYEENRSKFPLRELQKYAGQWVAFSSDGSRVLAHAETISDLEKRLIHIGVDPQNVAIEKIEFEDSRIGGAELL
jgi:hypothetical protein